MQIFFHIFCVFSLFPPIIILLICKSDQSITQNSENTYLKTERQKVKTKRLLFYCDFNIL